MRLVDYPPRPLSTRPVVVSTRRVRQGAGAEEPAEMPESGPEQPEPEQPEPEMPEPEEPVQRGPAPDPGSPPTWPSEEDVADTFPPPAARRPPPAAKPADAGPTDASSVHRNPPGWTSASSTAGDGRPPLSTFVADPGEPRRNGSGRATEPEPPPSDED